MYDWKRRVPEEMLTGSVKELFLFWRDNCDKTPKPTNDDLLKYNELFSLLENVFRNALLRPYMPAYRTINTNCGPYHFSESTIGEKLFSALEFRKNSEGMLNYEEADPEQTVVYALTCFVIWHFLSLSVRNRY